MLAMAPRCFLAALVLLGSASLGSAVREVLSLEEEQTNHEQKHGHHQPEPCGTDHPQQGQKTIHVSDCSGTGCMKSQNCAWCVYDLELCRKAWGAACDGTKEAREKEGIYDCNQGEQRPSNQGGQSSSNSCSEDHPDWGQKTVMVSGCQGFGCSALGVHDCAWCVYDMEKCEAKFVDGACKKVKAARDAQGVECNGAASPGSGSRKKEQQEHEHKHVHHHHQPEPCGTDHPQQGQKTIHVSDCSGAGCMKSQNCAWCVYDLELCRKAYDAACDGTKAAREKEGIYDCNQEKQSSSKSCSEDHPDWGQKTVIVPGCKGTGCNALGVHDCAWCVYDMETCKEKTKFEDSACEDVKAARDKQGVECA